MPATTPSLDFDADRVKRLRISLGETQSEFASRIGVSAGAVESWERSVYKPRSGRVIKALLEAEEAVAA